MNSPRRPWATLSLTLLMVVSSGCAAGLSSIRLVAADKAVQEALDKGADVQAPYEFTLAQRHYTKALEESGENEHKTCVQLARRAEELARESIIITEGGTRSLDGVDIDGEQLTDDQAPGANETPPDEGDTLNDGSEAPVDDGIDDDPEDAPEGNGDGIDDFDREEE